MRESNVIMDVFVILLLENIQCKGQIYRAYCMGHVYVVRVLTALFL